MRAVEPIVKPGGFGPGVLGFNFVFHCVQITRREIPGNQMNPEREVLFSRDWVECAGWPLSFSAASFGAESVVEFEPDGVIGMAARGGRRR